MGCRVFLRAAFGFWRKMTRLAEAVQLGSVSQAQAELDGSPLVAGEVSMLRRVNGCMIFEGQNKVSDLSLDSRQVGVCYSEDPGEMQRC
jgi:hypothetical protein